MDRMRPMQLAAVLLPAAIITSAVAWLARDTGYALSPEAAAIEAELAEREPELLLVGNSLVGHGVDEEALGEALGVSTASIWEAATRPANWYAVLENRVFGGGHHPEVVVIVNTPQMLLQTRVTSDKARRALIAQVSDYEPVINAKVYGRESADSLLWHRLESGRADFQEAARAAVRDLSAGLFFGGEGDLLQRGRAVAEPAMQAVFGGDDAVDMSLHHRVIPVLQDEEERVAEREARTVSVGESFVPDLIDLAEENGTRLVFVWIPVSPKATAAAALEPAVIAELLGLLNERGAGWIDLHELPIERSMFKDSVHLNSAGREVFTEALGEALEALGALSERPMPPARLPLVLRPEVSRQGTPPAPIALAPAPSRAERCGLRAALPELEPISVAALRAARLGPVSPVRIRRDGRELSRGVGWLSVERGCGSGQYIHQAGFVSISADPDHPEARYTLDFSDELPLRVGRYEGWWIYPEGGLRFDFDQAPERGRVRVWVQPFGEARVTASLDGQPLALRREAQWLTGEVPLSGRERWSLSLSAAGGFAALRRLAVREGGDPEADPWIDIVGEAALVEPARASFAPKRWSPELLAASGPLELLELEAIESRRGVGEAAIGPWSALGEVPVSRGVLCRYCSPLQVLEDGEPLPSSRLACKEVRAGLGGRYCTREGQVRFTALDGGDPSGGDRRYTLALDPDRGSSAGWWLYPGDVQVLPLSGRALRTLVSGGRVLRIEGAAYGESAPLHIVLRAGDQVLLDREIDAGGLWGDAPLSLPLAAPLDPGAGAVSLRLEAGEGSPLLLSDVAVSEVYGGMIP